MKLIKKLIACMVLTAVVLGMNSLRVVCAQERSAVRQTFDKDEYGSLFYSTDTYPHVWRFKSKANMRNVTIKLIGPVEEEVAVVDYDFLKGRMPLDFSLYLGEPKEFAEGKETVLKIPSGYSRQGDYPKAMSGWLVVKGSRVTNSFINKIVSDKDILERSKEITLATFQTRDDQQPYSYAFKLFVRTQGSYALNYGYHLKDGKIEGYLTDGENKFYSDEILTVWAKTLPAGTNLEVFGTCKMVEHEPLRSEQGLKEFREMCAQHKIQFTYHPGG